MKPTVFLCERTLSVSPESEENDSHFSEESAVETSHILRAEEYCRFHRN